MAKNGFLSEGQLQANIKALKSFMKLRKLDSFYLSSSDIFLNEYVPLEDCHRYYLTAFTGSTAECIVPYDGKVILFVDGRYYEQADIEVDPELVHVFKVPYGISLRQAMKEVILAKKLQVMGVEGDRIDLSLFNEFKTQLRVEPFNNSELSSVIDFKTLSFDKKIRELSLSLVGESTKDKLKRLVKPGEAFFISALDSIAWLTNMRRFELPNQSTFRAKALATSESVYLLMEHIEGEIKNESIELSLGKFSKLEDFLNDVKDYENVWKNLSNLNPNSIEHVYYSANSTNTADYLKLAEHFGEEKLINKAEGLVPFHALKNKAELQSMQDSFDRGDTAIFQTISWVKENVKNGVEFSELDFYHKTNEFYKNNGALEQSFNTISAIGANSSIIHFSSPSADVAFAKDQLVLLDSGGYFESGYATDTTRSFLSGGSASARQKEIYTLVLKSILHTQNAVFPENTWGSVVDGVARQPIFKEGLNYNHGTGHGVGINVHEGGYRLSTTSNIPLKENTVGSIEPGIYIPGFGGVRLENVAAVERHPVHKNMLKFRSMVFVGFDHDLIEVEMLSKEELTWLDEYEKECAKRGRSFKYKT
ncbi:MAG: M24 family metallopeptidase [Bacteriovoracaceae bacterium]|nr:M24 family metallopeptidase [Bacteriovoracaceae bacterium]